MRLSSRGPDETPDDPTAAASPDGTEVVLDENLHYGRAWHRYLYCFRRADPLRVLDAGCGTGLSSLALSRLNPGASVLGVDASASAIEIARKRSGEAVVGGHRFERHDFATPVPGAWGLFDFVVCRLGLGGGEEPALFLKNLARALDPGGLMLIRLPSRQGRQAAHALRRAVAALVPEGAGLEERVSLARAVVASLRPDHPIRTRFDRTPTIGTATEPGRGATGGTCDLIDALSDQHDWTLDEAIGMLGQAGLTFLYAASPWRWQPDLSFTVDPPSDLAERLDRLDPGRLSRVIDALDPAALGDDYQVFACLGEHHPSVPDWPRTRLEDPVTFDRLIPHLTHLAQPEEGPARASASQGRTLFRTVSGTYGEFDRISVLRLLGVDGKASCGAIDRQLTSRTRASDPAATHQACWMNLADSGLIVLEVPGSPDP